MKLGASYYPELVSETEWRRDLLNMREARLSVIRMNEFAWSSLEPREGEYAFGWLDRFLDLAHELGFEVILCTPTATPPAWLGTQYPEVYVELADGEVRRHGGRRDMDLDNEVYRYFSHQITVKLGERYGQHPAVSHWQLDNELFGVEGPDLRPGCHTRAATFRFRQYLPVHGEPLAEVLGLTVRHDFNLNAVQPVRMAASGELMNAEEYGDRVELTTATVLASCEGGPWAGSTAASVNTHGQGRTYHVALRSSELIARIAREAVEQAGLPVQAAPGEDAVVVPHLEGKGVWVFNYGAAPVTYAGVEVGAQDFAMIPSAR